jgi:DNA-binding PadR family transcriptional regulator
MQLWLSTLAGVHPTATETDDTPAHLSPGMTRYHQSGTRRDACALLHAEGELRAQRLKTRLEAHYDSSIEPSQFYSILDALEKTGHVEKRAEGLHDVYSLTEGGEQALLEHYDWLSECVEEPE